jgi:hypothetical protein
MNFRSYVASGKTDYMRAYRLLQEADRFEGCTSMIQDILLEPDRDFGGKSFLEARQPDAKLCGIAIYRLEPDHIFVELLCSDCKGTGTQMLAELSRLARDAGKPVVRLFSTISARGFYIKSGFGPVPGSDIADWGQLLQRAAGRTYRRRKSRKHGSTSLRRHKTRRVLPR